ncbi:hypothetical protein SAMN05428953_13648 [Mesorhizobium muleiense]|uniref:Uncharacterized protein n=1 Tax=Mesorhizobium muleiense TaxID=1004279 RepID=A0A1G9JZE4_9HYPH|nr:hypothetical protein SAMN05428953_13648 [Mesorhizobium muleiense]
MGPNKTAPLTALLRAATRAEADQVSQTAETKVTRLREARAAAWLGRVLS